MQSREGRVNGYARSIGIIVRSRTVVPTQWARLLPADWDLRPGALLADGGSFERGLALLFVHRKANPAGFVFGQNL